MAEQGEGLVEGAPTVRAGERLVVAVHVVLVLPEFRGAGKGLPTVSAAVGPLADVGADVLVVV